MLLDLDTEWVGLQETSTNDSSDNDSSDNDGSDNDGSDNDGSDNDSSEGCLLFHAMDGAVIQG